MLKVLELFGGIGACSKALERQKIPHETVDYVEIDKYAVKSFNAIHGTNFEPQDITKWDKDINVDLIMHGSPCQDFSISGKQAGGDKGSGTRSSLMYETLRIVEKLKPKYVIWENVKNIVSKKHKHNFDNYCRRMNELGYTNYAKIMDARNYGIPQHRERVFTISIRNDLRQAFVFPEPKALDITLKDLLEEEVDEKYYLSDKMINYCLGTNQRESKYPRKDVFIGGLKRANEQGIAGTITTKQGQRPVDTFVLEKLHIKTATKQGYEEAQYGDSVNLAFPNSTTRRGRVGKDVAQTLDTNYNIGAVLKDLKIRKLTPKECWRLMGFDDEDVDKASKVNSNAQLYKQAGNSIVVNCLEKIFKNLFGVMK